jgi:hypothetical protein
MGLHGLEQGYLYFYFTFTYICIVVYLLKTRTVEPEKQPLVRSGQVRLQLTVSQSVYLGVEPHLGPMARYLFIYYFFVKVAVLSILGRPV